MQEVRRNVPFVRGVTVSGGECTLHRDYLLELARMVRAENLDFLLDSNGSYDFSADTELLDTIDGVMLDDRLVEILGVKMPCVDEGFGKNKPVDVVIRPEDVELVDPADGYMEGDVTSLIFKGVHYELDVMANGYEWLVHTTKHVPVGTHVGIRVTPFNIQIMHKPESSDEKAVEIDE